MIAANPDALDLIIAPLILKESAQADLYYALSALLNLAAEPLMVNALFSSGAMRPLKRLARRWSFHAKVDRQAQK